MNYNNAPIRLIKTAEDILEAYNVAKMFKYPIIGMYKGYIFGTDEGFNILAVTESNLYAEQMISFPKKYLSYAKNPNDFLYISDDGFLDRLILDVKEKNSDTGETEERKEIIYMNSYSAQSNHVFMNYINTDIEYGVIYEKDNIHESDEFIRYRSSASADGNILYIPENTRCAMYIPIGVLPLNKSDKLNIKIYYVNESLFISRFIINKGKKGVIDIYMTYFYIL